MDSSYENLHQRKLPAIGIPFYAFFIFPAAFHKKLENLVHTASKSPVL